MSTQNYSTDIVVVGSGMGGLSAAVEASEYGAKVIVIESQSIIGGNSNLTEGVMGVGTPLQEELGIHIDVDGIFHLEQEFQNYNVNPKLWEIIFKNSAANIAWLIDHGITFATVSSPCDGQKTWHVYDGPEESLGFEANNKLRKAAENAGTKILLNTEGRSLKIKDGVVVGIEAENSDGDIVSIDAKAVILAGGGFGSDMAKVEKVTGREAEKMHCFGTPGNNGTCMQMAMQAGADEPKNAVVSLVGLSVDGTDVFSHLSATGCMEPTNIWLNQDGERFGDEAIVSQYSRCANLIMTQRKAVSIYDQDSFDRFEKDGCINGWGMFVLPGVPCTNLRADIETYKDNKDIVIADSLEEIAAAFDMPPEAVKRSVEEYNGFVAVGNDAKYHKNSAFLKPVSRPPFYAFRVKGNNLNTMGGIRIDGQGHVLSKDYKPIPGLFAAGMDCSGFSGETYGMIIPGSCQGIALGTGRIAGAEAAKSVIA